MIVRLIERDQHAQDPERYYNVFALSWLDSVNNCILTETGYYRNSLLQKGFPETPHYTSCSTQQFSDFHMSI